MKVKICGITNLSDAILSEKYGADAIGFIFYKESPRYISPYSARQISLKLSPFTSRVGVFVNEEPKTINEISEKVGLNYIQLHGDEDKDFIKKIRSPVIKSFRIKKDFNFAILDNFEKVHYLLDSYSDEHFGGTGKQFDTSMIPKSLRSKIILAGGISANNIEYIFNTISPAAVDLSSSLELSPGIKDGIKLEQFFNKLNNLRFKC